MDAVASNQQLHFMQKKQRVASNRIYAVSATRCRKYDIRFPEKLSKVFLTVISGKKHSLGKI